MQAQYLGRIQGWQRALTIDAQKRLTDNKYWIFLKNSLKLCYQILTRESLCEGISRDVK